MKKLMITLAALATLTAGCGDKDACDEGYNECDGDILMECVDGELVEAEDCAASQMTCHVMGGGDDHCMDDGGDSGMDM